MYGVRSSLYHMMELWKVESELIVQVFVCLDSSYKEDRDMPGMRNIVC